MMNKVPEHILHWESYDKLYYRGEYEALIALQKAYVKNHPENIRERLILADAYGYAGQHQAALKILKKLHKISPYDAEFTHALVECLDKLKEDPKEFSWRRAVVIFESADETQEWCYKYLLSKGPSQDAFNLLFEMEVAGYVRFDEEQLIEYLSADERFRIERVGIHGFPKIELKESQACSVSHKMIV